VRLARPPEKPKAARTEAPGLDLDEVFREAVDAVEWQGVDRLVEPCRALSVLGCGSCPRNPPTGLTPLCHMAEVKRISPQLAAESVRSGKTRWNFNFRGVRAFDGAAVTP